MTTPEQQQNRLLECLSDPTCKVAYWCSDQWGGPANHQCDNYGAEWRAYPGRVDDIGGDPEPCSDRGLHATDYPHQWKGTRVWIVGLWNWVCGGNKYISTRREIICEITPESVISQSVAAQMNLSLADLSGADLSDADLSLSRLSGADLSGADLSWADLSLSRLSGADLSRARLSWADLSRADLSVADLSGARLSGANLSGARLSGCDMHGITGTTLTQRLDFAARGAINVDTETR